MKSFTSIADQANNMLAGNSSQTEVKQRKKLTSIDIKELDVINTTQLDNMLQNLFGDKVITVKILTDFLNKLDNCEAKSYFFESIFYSFNEKINEIILFFRKTIAQENDSEGSIGNYIREVVKTKNNDYIPVKNFLNTQRLKKIIALIEKVQNSEIVLVEGVKESTRSIINPIVGTSHERKDYNSNITGELNNLFNPSEPTFGSKQSILKSAFDIIDLPLNINEDDFVEKILKLNIESTESFIIGIYILLKKHSSDITNIKDRLGVYTARFHNITDKTTMLKVIFGELTYEFRTNGIEIK